MLEFVGNCYQCDKKLYCRDGFLDGVVVSEKRMLCFDCAEKEKEAKE